MIYALVALLLVGAALSACSFNEFGATPRGAALEKVERSPNFQNGKFHNLKGAPSTPSTEPGERKSMTATMWEFFFSG